MSEPIFSIDGKNANTLAQMLYPPSDVYQQRIFEAAQTLTINGRGDAVYHTQWSSGTTVWDYQGHACIVKPRGQA